MLKNAQWLDITEYQTEFVDKEVLSEAVGQELWTRYAKQIDLEFPNPKTNGKWKLYSRGWVGYIPLNGSYGIHIKPRVPIANLYQMLEYAYKLESIKSIDGVITCNSVKGLYERLANQLALRILSRCQKGLYKSYVDEEDNLPYLRGRLNTHQWIKKHPTTLFPCEYQEQTYDNEDNQILTWTLNKIIRSGFVTREQTLANVRAAFKKMKCYTTIQLFRSSDCLRRKYHRLNQDYELLHSLCRMFLDLQSPTHETGNMQTVPFLVNMARLYELFVAEWLKRHVPKGYQVRAQEKMEIGDGILRFNIDLVLYNLEQGKVQCVLDTKYKISSLPSNNDVNQVVTYAISKGCKEAILVYPLADIKQIDEHIGDVRVRTLNFSVDQDIDLSGELFLKQFRSSDCLRRKYHRLNQDYELLHSLCRMFLDLQSPTHETGNMQTVPFLVNMARLYELFVAEWLKRHVPKGYQVRAQEKMEIGDGILRFNIDLVLYNLEQGKVQCVLDTKYKISSLPSNNDVNQVVTYAISKGCKEAILVYPLADIKQIDEHIGDVRVRTLNFSVDQDIDLSGELFLKQLFRGFAGENT